MSLLYSLQLSNFLMNDFASLKVRKRHRTANVDMYYPAWSKLMEFPIKDDLGCLVLCIVECCCLWLVSLNLLLFCSEFFGYKCICCICCWCCCCWGVCCCCLVMLLWVLLLQVRWVLVMQVLLLALMWMIFHKTGAALGAVAVRIACAWAVRAGPFWVLNAVEAIIHTILQCDLPPLRLHCGEAPGRN